MMKMRKFQANFNIWAVLSIIAISLIVLPNLHIVAKVFTEPNDNWRHIKQFLLQEYLTNTISIITFTGLLTAMIGTSLAWLVSAYEYPLRSFFKWGLILPLAIPPYIAAYTYTGLVNYTGIIQTFLRGTFNLRIDQKYVDIMSMEGTIFIFSFFLFPYVYTITRAFMANQSAALLESSRMLGRSPMETFWSVILPLSRGAIVGGACLVILEVINDYGVVQYFGITTFSTAIFKAWFGLGDVDTASKLAGILLLMVVILLVLEHLLRGGRRFGYSTTKVRPIQRMKLTGIKAGLAFVYSCAVFCIGFLIPVLQLLYWAFITYQDVLSEQFYQLTLNTLGTALISAGVIMVMALIIANYARISQGLVSRMLARITVMGYSIPGAVIAIGVLIFFIAIDRNLGWLYKVVGLTSTELVLSSSVVLLIFAYIIRFIGVGFNSVEAGFEKVGRKFFEASRTLGMGITETFFKVDLRMISPAILSGLILVFVDILKELPLALMLRPFNFETLATKAYQYAGDELIQEASIPSLIIILISCISVYFFNKVAEKEG